MTLPTRLSRWCRINACGISRRVVIVRRHKHLLHKVFAFCLVPVVGQGGPESLPLRSRIMTSLVEINASNHFFLENCSPHIDASVYTPLVSLFTHRDGTYVPTQHEWRKKAHIISSKVPKATNEVIPQKESESFTFSQLSYLTPSP